MKKNKEKCKSCANKVTVLESYGEIYPDTGRKLYRPKINWFVVILQVLFAVLFSAFLGITALLVVETFLSPALSETALFWICVGTSFLLYILMSLKGLTIFSIRLYQKFGPYELRSRCIYYPNCSEYMILAIRKYGLFKGVKMGKNRFRRCVEPNGGVDFP